MKMKTLQLKGLKRYEIIEVPVPEIADDQVLVRVDVIGICGSDIGIWRGHHFFNELYKWDEFEPGEHGHEAVGTVVKVGKDVKHLKEGDQVVRLKLYDSWGLKMHCFAEYTVSDCAIKCNGKDPEVMCFTDPVMVGLNHIYHSKAQPGDWVVVMGQGLLGLIVTQLLRQNHINVIATDINERRLALAHEYGAITVNASDKDYRDKILGISSDISSVIECSGADEPVDTACHLIKRGGTIVIMGAYRFKVTLSYTQLRIKGGEVKFPMNRVNCKDNWGPAAEILANGRIEVKRFVDKRDKLFNLQNVLENYNDDWLRVVLYR